MKVLQLVSGILMLVAIGFSDIAAETWCIKPDGTGDAPTIQAGIDSATTSDIVLLASGTYTGLGNRDINFMEKSITLTSESGPEATIIDCQGLGKGFIISCLQPSSQVLSGLTVRNGTNAVDCWDYATPTIVNNIFIDNTRSAIFCELATRSTISGNIFIGNNGAINLSANATITDNMFIGNHGSAIYAVNFIGPTITGNVFYGNTGSAIYGVDLYGRIENNTLCENGRGIYLYNSYPTIHNTIIASSVEGAAVECSGTSSPTVTCCDLFGNAGGDLLCGVDGGGNFSADPQFCGILGSNNYYLQSDSPCAPGNHPDGYDCGLIGAYSVGCGPTSTEDTSWGKIKNMYK